MLMVIDCPFAYNMKERTFLAAKVQPFMSKVENGLDGNFDGLDTFLPHVISTLGDIRWKW